MTNETFLKALQAQTEGFAHAVATDEGQWIVKGFIDVHKRIYTISLDTKIVSKVLELLLFPMLKDFGKQHGLRLDLSLQQNFYPDISFVDEAAGTK
ncbi:MAG TPA: type II restriction endonuclease, partial [Verrucomicrobiota bacterium]|nr:type II restriction endonuclease [Verrucomicrobiota bacterium]